ncbi:C-type lectin domain family 12 member B [Camelus dromedarius]|uniref:C-type lectin domain family 12 member B n=1 Tax=Camelus dromedarius TaxID=9838 RepID=A0A5N4C5P0_CAMDR|nr:C-type lectin domain family 12 member B [Camelus dromedarius]
MSEEVTYATLSFQDSVAAGNNWDGNNLRKRGRKARCDLGEWTGVRCPEVLALRPMLKRGVVKINNAKCDNQKAFLFANPPAGFFSGYPAPSPIWRQAALGLLALCLMLLIGLVTLGIMFCFLLCLGVLQTSDESNSDSEKLSQLQKVIHEQQDNLSQQLSNHRSFPTEEASLQSQISSLLKRQGQMAIKLCQELITHTSGNQDLLTNQIKPVAPVFRLITFSANEYAQVNGSKGCAYFQKGNIYISRCSAEISWICEKTAASVKIGDLDE